MLLGVELVVSPLYGHFSTRFSYNLMAAIVCDQQRNARHVIHSNRGPCSHRRRSRWVVAAAAARIRSGWTASTLIGTQTTWWARRLPVPPSTASMTNWFASTPSLPRLAVGFISVFCFFLGFAMSVPACCSQGPGVGRQSHIIKRH